MMKKAPHKLSLRQETVRQLQALDEQALRQVRGGANPPPALDVETGRGCDAPNIITATARG